MAPLRKYRSDYTDLEYCADQRNGPIMMCDILGFKNFVINTDMENLKQEMMQLLDKYDSVENLMLGLDLFESHKLVHDKLSKIPLPKDYALKTFLFSDTIFLYPKKEYKDLPYWMEVLILAAVSKAFFINMLTNHHFLLRGSIASDEYCIIDNQRMIFGKGVIEAYNLESIQNWGGILLSPKVIEKLQPSDLSNPTYVEYSGLPFNKNKKKDFLKLCSNESCVPYVLNWPMNIEKVDWDSLYRRLDKIDDNKIRISAKCKIDNTKIFFELMRSQIING